MKSNHHPFTLENLLKVITLRIEKIAGAASQEPTWIFTHCLNIPAAHLYTDPARQLTSTETKKIVNCVARRERGEPLAYILGSQPFCDLTLKVTPHTLIPRPETEVMVQAVLNQFPQDTPKTIADLGTGSGAIALALANARKKWQVVAVDASFEALWVARENRTQYHLSQVYFVWGDWGGALAPNSVDVIVSNPPYVAIDSPHMAQDVSKFEPHTALFAGDHGLAAIQALLPDAKKALKPGGYCFIEHGFNQAKAVVQAFESHGFGAIETCLDNEGLPRFTTGRS